MNKILTVFFFLLFPMSLPSMLVHAEDWPHVGGAAGGGHFSTHKQINRDNLDDLEVAWIHRSGDFREGGNFKDGNNYPEEPLQTALQVTPILFNNALYYCTPFNRIFALNPETGEELWTYDPKVDLDEYAVPRCRGVSAWTSSKVEPGQACHKRIIAPVIDARVIALDALTGKRCSDFGSNGEINLREGLGDHPNYEYLLTSPPAIAGDLAIVGSAVTDNITTSVPGGVVRAYDLNNGKLAWFWEPIPPNTEAILTEEGQLYQRATTNVWSIMSFDPELNLVYLPTGNTSPDYYGGLRNGSDYYSSSVVALHADSGEVAWHFQTVHHDIWDYDVPSQPTLYDVTMGGKKIKALAQTTKMGYVFLLNRETGEPLFPVEERPVPQGAAPGDFTSATQPFPTKPPTLHDTKFGPDDVWGLTPWDKNACRERLAGLRSEGLFTPPSVGGSVHFPSAVGGQNWGGPSVDMDRKVLVVNTLHMASLVELIPREQCAQAAIDRKNDPLQKKFASVEPSEGTPYCNLRWVGFFSPLELPCSPPPWGTIAGIDLATGELLWQVPLGTTRDLAPFPVWFIEGAPNTGGPMSTASGLTFIAATTDFFLRAFDTMTGEELWSARLPTGGHATPMSYQTESGKQFVVIAAGGHYSFGTPPSDHIMAFALEDD
ncbi:MAG: pyrroloquinoline quinone-dependent dehydrogenase [Halioglobus sp.]